MTAKSAGKLLLRLAQTKQSCLILDGGMGTSLNSLGLNECEAWSSPHHLNEEPIRIAVKNVHKQFLNSGVDILTTNTYNSVIPVDVVQQDYTKTQWVIDNINIAKECVDEHNAKQGSYTKCNVDAGPLIALSVGSFATTIGGRAETANKEMSNTDIYRCKGYGFPATEIVSYFNGRLSDEILNHATESGVGVVAFETIGDLMEVEIICDVLCSKGDILTKTGLSTWVTLTCVSENSVDTGSSVTSCVEELAKCPYVSGVGVNCTEPHLISSLVKTIKLVLKECNAEEKLIVVYPNSGETYLSRDLIDGEVEHWRKSPECTDWNFADSAIEWIEQGVHIIGGCCRINATDIFELKQKLARTAKLL